MLTVTSHCFLWDSVPASLCLTRYPPDLPLRHLQGKMSRLGKVLNNYIWEWRARCLGGW